MKSLLKGAKDMIFAFSSLFISLIVFLFILPKYGTIDDIGFLRYIYNNANLLLIFIHLGLPFVILKYFHHLKSKEQRVFNFFQFIVFSSSFIVLFILFNVLKNQGIIIFKEFKQIQTLNIILLFSFSSAFILSLSNYAICIKKPHLSSNYSSLVSRFFLLILIILFSLNFVSLKFVGIGIAILQVINTLIHYYFLNRIQPIKFEITFKFSQKINKFKELINYTSFTLFSSLGHKITSFLDEIMITNILGFSYGGVYGIGLISASIVSFPFNSLSKVLLPTLNVVLANNNKKEILTVYRYSSLLGLFYSGVLFVFMIFGSEFLFSIIPNGYNLMGSIPIFILVGLSQVGNASFGNNSEIINLSKYYKYNFYGVLILGILTIISNYIFIKLWGMMGAAYASLIVLMMYNIYKFFVVWTKFGIIPFTYKNLYLLLLILGAYCLVELIQLDSLILSFFIKSVCFSIILFIGIVVTKLNKVLFKKLIL